MAVERYQVKGGGTDPLSGRHLWNGLVVVRDGIIVDTAPVWGIYMGKPMKILVAIAKERGYIVEVQP